MPYSFKKLYASYITILTFLLASGLWAQNDWDTTTNNMIHYINGNVGIGLTTPGAKLDVNGESIFRATGTFGVAAHIRDTGGANSMTIRAHTDRGEIVAQNNRDFAIKDNQDNVLFYGEYGGNVGIGTDVPDGQLEVSGNSGVYSDFAGYSGTTNNILPNDKEPTLVISENLSGTLTPGVTGQVTYRGGLSFGHGGPGIYSVNPNPAGSRFYGDIRFHTTFWNGSGYSNSDRMIIKLDGNVGIGTNNPDELLTVKGTVHAREVKVDLQGALAPDYVFAPDYELLSLKETEDYIKANRHLPEVPSAAEIQEEGLHLKEMNLLLLKKVEELTLHTIRQEKEIQQLKKELAKNNTK